MPEPPDTNPSFAAIYSALRDIPAGTVVSYGELARLAGLPGRARLAGTALREARGEDAPTWYRVIRADGSLAFPPGTESHRRQRKLLESEGVIFAGNRVQRADPVSENIVDAALWGPST